MRIWGCSYDKYYGVSSLVPQFTCVCIPRGIWWLLVSVGLHLWRLFSSFPDCQLQLTDQGDRQTYRNSQMPRCHQPAGLPPWWSGKHVWTYTVPYSVYTWVWYVQHFSKYYLRVQSIFYVGGEENTNLCSLGPLYHMLLIEVVSLPEILSWVWLAQLHLWKFKNWAL